MVAAVNESMTTTISIRRMNHLETNLDEYLNKNGIMFDVLGIGFFQ